MDHTVPPPTPAPESPVPNTRKNLFILVGFILLCIVALGAYILGKQAGTNTTARTGVKFPDPTNTQVIITPLSSPLPEHTVKIGWKLYTDTKYLFSFQHPDVNFNSTCCAISGPLTGHPDMRIVLADSTTVGSGDQSFNGIGVYVDENVGNTSFTEYIAAQKQSLLENYTLMTDKDNSTQATEYSITIDGRTGVELKGYAWWADMIYIPFPDDKTILILVKTGSETGSFDDVFKEIVSTFTFSGYNISSNVPLLPFVIFEPPLSGSEYQLQTEEIMQKVIEPYIDYYRETEGDGYVTAITVRLQNDQDMKENYPYQMEITFSVEGETGKEHLSLMQHNGILDWWVPVCQDCNFSPSFKEKYPEIVKTFGQ